MFMVLLNYEEIKKSLRVVVIFILRISWLISEFGKNFVKTILFKLRAKNDLRIVDDQIGTPISSCLVTEIISLIILNKINLKNISS